MDIFFAIIFLQVAFADCDHDLKDEDWLSSECNWAGICTLDGQCLCCDSTAGDDDFCEGLVPGVWTLDEHCKKAKYFTSVTWGYMFDDANISCVDDTETPSVPSFLDATENVIIGNGYEGIVLAQACEVCTVASPCLFFSDAPPTSGTFVKFGTDLNTHYDHSCAIGKLPASPEDCDANFDNGASANEVLLGVLDVSDDYQQHIADMNAELVTTTVMMAFSNTESQYTSSIQTTRFPSPMPTPAPITAAPTTAAPTEYGGKDESEDDECSDYVNSVEDLVFVDAGSSCLGNINESWTGGRTCASPYIICLPDENTPSFDIMGEPYKNKTHKYTVEECLKECSYDQRCLGVQFVADFQSNTGKCSLIDDIPIAVEDRQNIPENEVDLDSVLDNSTTGGNALCWEKRDQCNPYFEAEDLNDVMLKCYCPNNRKGFYTKKVKRTVNNTRYCNDDSSVDERIKKAQANRMFHLCENWCLFETSNPAQENWYWDPWKQCWRETYSAIGVHTGFCDRVIRNPDSIEFKFMDYRLKHFCAVTEQPTAAPVTNITWVLAEVLESCDGACSRGGSSCAAASRFPTEEAMSSAFSEAGATCGSSVMNRTKFEGFALPGIKNSECVNRQLSSDHLEDLDDCNRIIGGLWQRLCACY